MKPLNGLRILELTHMVSGPYAGMILADLGAESIKVEPPERGEMTRGLLANDPGNSVQGMGAYFLTLNRNKKSVTINLKSNAGRAIFYELAKVSDIVLNNFSVGVMERLKISHAYLSEINPRIITCTISGFGETGPDKDRPAYDMVSQAISGVMSVTGPPEGEPVRAGIPMADLASSMMAVIGILASLAAREQTGQGQHVDISMLDTQISMLTYLAAMHLLSGEIPSRLGSEHSLHVPYNVFPCQDGYIILAVITDEFWQNLMEVVLLPELYTEENRAREGRQKNRAWINGRLSQAFQTRPRDFWLDKLNTARIPCAPVNNLAQALGDSQVLARNMVVEVAHPLGDRARVPGNPIKLSSTPSETFSSPPLLGQHNAQILGELLGKSAAELINLKAAGNI
jgi:CoA:oxalate CoA-transferase